MATADGTRRSYATKTVSVMVLAILATSAFTTIIPGAAFAVTDPSASMNLWSPHSDTGNDGTPTSTFTFSADATASAGLQRIEWDFDGDGAADTTTPISGAPNHVNGVTATHIYGDENVFWPQVRSVDMNNAVSDWNRYSVGGSDVPLDVFWPPPMITMLAWQPFTADIGTPITFSATAFNEVGVQQFHWDFDGDGEADDATPAVPFGAQDASGSITHTYTGAISAFPAVRALDNDGFVSEWDVYDINGQPVQIVIGSSSVPTATMNQWNPYSASGFDGLPNTSFTFSASGTGDAGIARVEWDFNGDGVVDETTPISGSPTSVNGITATHVYNNAGQWTPQVRVVDVNNLPSPWAAFMVSGSPVSLDTSAPMMNPVLTFLPRAPSDIGSDGNTATVFTFTTTFSNVPVSFKWDFNGDGVTDATTTQPTATHTYPAAGSYLPTVTVVDEWGTTELAYPLNSSGQWEDVDVSPMAPTATMNQWSPYSASSADGDKNTVFTLSADATAPGGIASLEWDFNSDGTVDITTPVSGAPQSVTAVTATYVYGADGNYTPKVRAVDTTGQTSAWDAYNIALVTPVLDVVTPAPVATMNQWSPFTSTGPDGYTTTTFTLSANATSVVGIDRLEWDFDGNGSVDATTDFNGETSVSSATKTHVYGAVGSYTPKVRTVDTDGQSSAWDAYNSGSTVPTLDVATSPANSAPVANAGPDQTVVLGSTVTLDGTGSSDPDSGDTLTYTWSQNSGPISVALNTANPAKPTFTATPAGTYVFELKVKDSIGAQSTPDTIVVTVVSAPVATLGQWSPYSASGPDGTSATVFTFSANASASAGIARLEWDFDGNGSVDATSAITGAPTTVTGATKTFTYGADGTYTPKVRAVDAGNNLSAWDAFNLGSTIIQLDVATPQQTGDLYCNGKTIEQLIASHQYNVIDKRNTGAVNIYGTSGNDLILGNNLSNYIDGKGGDDCIIAFGGDDTVYDYNGDSSNGGTDWLYGGDGNDKLYALNGDDYVYGGNGNDYIQGDDGNDKLYGEAGDDTIEDSRGNDLSDGGPGTDKCTDTKGTNTIINCELGQPPVATLNQWSPYSASGADGTPTTAFSFSASATSVTGIAKFEWDFKGDGTVDATTPVTGSPASATATATFTYNAAGTWTPQVRAVDTYNQVSAWDAFNSGSTIIKLDTANPQPSGDLYCNGKTIDQLIASGQYNVIDNRNGQRKTLNGSNGNDLILASKYGDVINAKKGNDCVIGGAGDDIIHGHQGDDQIYGNGGNDRIFGDSGDDKLYGGAGNDVIYGDNGNDVINGGAGNDDISGGNGNNTIDGSDGNDGCDDDRGRSNMRNIERNYRNDHRDDDHGND
ncbi:PKD domain-containing protein [Nitrososphaera viennensis]|uniref:PKD domain-containing protein n=2 Tax=Nitrososphaera viennensis TaxID=1034015 RepID=A0A977IEG4_9ARCH|nr:PKD domain-containing protein [Nitrososphaera viennensis]AIC14281.1 putative surface-associated Ca2+-binding protein, hemolysin-type [Nitrososphaera viennensis EN76]UVS69277.1 PKD domain-containing protein [Nitrososphaera viennensis]